MERKWVLTPKPNSARKNRIPLVLKFSKTLQTFKVFHQMSCKAIGSFAYSNAKYVSESKTYFLIYPAPITEKTVKHKIVILAWSQFRTFNHNFQQYSLKMYPWRNNGLSYNKTARKLLDCVTVIFLSEICINACFIDKWNPIDMKLLKTPSW